MVYIKIYVPKMVFFSSLFDLSGSILFLSISLYEIRRKEMPPVLLHECRVKVTHLQDIIAHITSLSFLPLSCFLDASKITLVPHIHQNNSVFSLWYFEPDLFPAVRQKCVCIFLVHTWSCTSGIFKI